MPLLTQSAKLSSIASALSELDASFRVAVSLQDSRRLDADAAAMDLESVCCILMPSLMMMTVVGRN